jgi:type II secretory pathway component PulF
LHEALQTSGLFHADFIDMVASGEEGGRVPEMMRHLAEQYQDETKRRMTMLTGAAAGVIGVGVAGFIIFFIFYFFINNYLGMINNIR